MRLPFTKYGVRELCCFGSAMVIAVLICMAVFPPLSIVFALGCLFVAFFFRDPNRVPPEGERNVVAPADGKVVEISDAHETEFLNTDTTKIGIFLSVFDVHVNRAPVTGRVESVQHKPGKFLNALRPESAQENESNSVVLSLDAPGSPKVLVKQIAGVIARRIVCACAPSQVLQRGQAFGMIKFGSRTELYVPKSVNFEVSVQKGQKVRAGETILGVLR